jgi:hypothetical protein
MEEVNPFPVLRRRIRTSQSDPSQAGKSPGAIRKAEGSSLHRLDLTISLGLATQKFDLPAGRGDFKRTEILSLGECFLVVICLRLTLRSQCSRTSSLPTVPKRATALKVKTTPQPERNLLESIHNRAVRIGADVRGAADPAVFG